MKENKGESGIVFIWLIVTVGVMAVVLAAAVQPATVMMQRDREEELIFRGEEYAEAIRAYQKDHGGQVPTQLKDLLKPGGPQKGRYLRRPYTNPFDLEEGKWGLLSPGMTVFRPDASGKMVPMDPKDLKPGEVPATGFPTGQQGLPGMGGQLGQPLSPGMAGQPGMANPMGQVLPFKFGGEEGQPILGVYAPQKVEAFKEYMNRRNINEWAFSPLVIQPKQLQRPGTPIVPNQPGQPGLPGQPGMPGRPGLPGGKS